MSLLRVQEARAVWLETSVRLTLRVALVLALAVALVAVQVVVLRVEAVAAVVGLGQR